VNITERRHNVVVGHLPACPFGIVPIPDCNLYRGVDMFHSKPVYYHLPRLFTALSHAPVGALSDRIDNPQKRNLTPASARQSLVDLKLASANRSSHPRPYVKRASSDGSSLWSTAAKAASWPPVAFPD